MFSPKTTGQYSKSAPRKFKRSYRSFIKSVFVNSSAGSDIGDTMLIGSRPVPRLEFWMAYSHIIKEHQRPFWPVVGTVIDIAGSGCQFPELP